MKPGVPISHLIAAGNYIREKEPDVVVVAGDWWDMPMLSSYEPAGSTYWHGERSTIFDDIKAGNDAMKKFLSPILKAKKPPRLVFLEGNHEYRIIRECEQNPRLRGLLDRSSLELQAFEFHPFLRPVDINGVLYAHYFQNPQSLKKTVISGTMDNRLNKIKQSFTMGHQQTRMWGSQWTTDGREICGLVAGAFYQHDEKYLGEQGNHYWRGIVVKNEVNRGRYDPCFVSLDFLLRKYT